MKIYFLILLSCCAIFVALCIIKIWQPTASAEESRPRPGGLYPQQEELTIKTTSMGENAAAEIPMEGLGQGSIGWHGQIGDFHGPLFDHNLRLSHPSIKEFLNSGSLTYKTGMNLPDGPCRVRMFLPAVVQEAQLTDKKVGFQGVGEYERAVKSGVIRSTVDMEFNDVDLIPVKVFIEKELHRRIHFDDFYLIYREQQDSEPFLSVNLKHFSSISEDGENRTAILHVQPGYYVNIVADVNDIQGLQYMHASEMVDLRAWSSEEKDLPFIRMTPEPQEAIEVIIMKNGNIVEPEDADGEWSTAVLEFSFSYLNARMEVSKVHEAGVFIRIAEGAPFRIPRSIFEYMEHIRLNPAIPRILVDDLKIIGIQHEGINPRQGTMSLKTPITKEAFLKHDIEEAIIFELE